MYSLPEDVESAALVPKMLRSSILPSNKPTRVLVRLYVISGHGLSPMDVGSSTDAYIEIEAGDVSISRPQNYIPSDLNPVFGE